MTEREQPVIEIPITASSSLSFSDGEIDIKRRKITDNAARREKVSWNRKMNAMVKLMAKLRPIEREIIELQSHKIPIFDKITKLRQTMVEQCVHPYEQLVYKKDYFECKFCGKNISIPKD